MWYILCLGYGLCPSRSQAITWTARCNTDICYGKLFLLNEDQIIGEMDIDIGSRGINVVTRDLWCDVGRYGGHWYL